MIVPDAGWQASKNLGFRKAGLDAAALAGDATGAAVVARPDDPTRGWAEKLMAETWIEVSTGGGDSEPAIQTLRSAAVFLSIRWPIGSNCAKANRRLQNDRCPRMGLRRAGLRQSLAFDPTAGVAFQYAQTSGRIRE